MSQFANSPKKIRMDIKTFNSYLLKSCRSDLSEVFFEKTFSKFLEYSKENVPYGEQFK